MHPRRSSAIAAGALLLAGPLLTSCGFEYATDRVNTIANGVNDREGQVDVLGAVIISGEPDVGALTGTLVNNSTEDYAELSGVVGGDAGGLTQLGTPEPISLKPYGQVNLNDEAIPVTGTFEPGDFVDVTFQFTSGQTSTLQVQVVRPCNYYADLVTLPSADGNTAVAPNSTGDPETDPYSCEIAKSDVGHGAEE